MNVESILLNIILGVISGIVLTLLLKIPQVVRTPQFIVALKALKLIIIHVVISLLILQLGQSFSLQIRLLLIVLVNFLIWLTWVRDSQIKRFGAITLKSKRFSFYSFEVNKLKQTGEEKLELTWETVGKGLEHLVKTIKGAPSIAPNIIFGVNEMGIIAASYLCKQLDGEPRLGVIRTRTLVKRGEGKTDNRAIIQFDCPGSSVSQFDGTVKEYPDVKIPETIIIVDNELKTGVSIKNIMERLKSIYGEQIDIIYIPLCGVIRKEDKKRKIDDIRYFGWNIEETKYKPDFMAFYADSPGMRGPAGLR